MSAQIILGINPGAHGAIAVLDEGGDLLDVVDMPSTPEGNGRSATNAPLLAGLLARTHAPIAFCEFVSARFGVRRWPRSWRHRGLCRRAFLSAAKEWLAERPTRKENGKENGKSNPGNGKSEATVAALAVRGMRRVHSN
jgi:hypothetical protein